MFTFNYDLQVLTDLRGAMNENTFLAINKTNKHKEKFYYQSWGRMCAAMDRIDDTVGYINTLELGKNNSEVAFDFYDFINNIYVVIENIKAMANIFEVDTSPVERLSSSFNLQYSDDEWFSYVRSLCSVHPTETTFSHHKKIMLNEKMGCCTSVDWDMSHRLASGDLVAIIYNFPEDTSNGANVPEYTYKYIPLNVVEFQHYLQRWLDFIPEIIVGIRKYNNTKYEEFRQIPIKKLSDCKNDLERIAILRNEYNRRYGDDIDEVFDFYATVFAYRLSNPANNANFEKYKEAIRLSLTFLYNALQNMSFDGYENSGLKNDNSSFLFYELYYADTYELNTLKKYGYNLSKIYSLYTTNYFEKDRIRRLLDEMKEAVNKYVAFTNTELEDETVILIQMAIYFDALESYCILNKNIPNELKYRLRLLSNDEVDDLSKERKDEPSSLIDALPKELRDLFE
ncbi:MAG: hypothetical protein HDT28_01320 [Clostridiales bacterium]|nr:hypothetical protein [Clostridiales bacterium]